MLTNWKAKDIIAVGKFETIANKISVILKYAIGKDVSHCSVWRNLEFFLQDKFFPLVGVQGFETRCYSSGKKRKHVETGFTYPSEETCCKSS